MKLLIELHYLPSIPYFVALQAAEKIVLEKHEHYVKQSFRNRCYILTSQGVERLVVPLTEKNSKSVITDIKIDYSQKWLNNHWRAIESAYRNAPFFEHYAEDLHLILFKKHPYLYDLNREILTICLKWLQLQTPVEETMAYEKNPPANHHDMRNLIHAKKQELMPNYYQPIPYTQVFGNKFVQGMSIIDLVFCEGPNARSVITSCSVQE